MKETTLKTPTHKAVDLILKEIKDYETGTEDVTDYVSLSQYDRVQAIKTHQNGGFLTALAPGQTDDREYFDVVSRTVETAVVNNDLDTENFDPYTLNLHHQNKAFIAKAHLKNFFKQTTHGKQINECQEQFFDEGNLVVRKVDNEIYRAVDLRNLYVINQTARTLEETTVIEKQVMSYTELREMKEFSNIDKVAKYANASKSEDIPYYEIFYRYGEMTLADLNYIKARLDDGFSYQENDKDNQTYIMAVIAIARTKKKHTDLAIDERQGIPVFAEELKPEIIKITKRLKIKKYKPYIEAHLGRYEGVWLRKGYREIGIPYQNRANNIANRLKQIMKHLKLIYQSSDEKLEGKNILSGFKDGDIIKARDFSVLNNQFPNLNFYVEEWNRNSSELRQSVKDFEVSTGESLPSSTTATAIAIQNQKVGLYYSYTREKMGLFFSEVYNRWVLPELMKTDMEETIEIIGDPSYVERYVDSLVDNWFLNDVLKATALKGGYVTQEEAEQLKQIQKENLLKQPKLFEKLEKDFYKDVELYVDINVTGESFNKQNKIVNGFKALEYLSNPIIMQNPVSRDLLTELLMDIGVNVDLGKINTQEQAPQMAGAMPNTGNMPTKEQSPVQSTLNNAQV